MSNDYQDQMDKGTRDIDAAGNKAGAKDTDEQSTGEDSDFGTLPSIAIPIEYTTGRRDYFRREVEGAAGASKRSYQLGSEKRMLENFTWDLAKIPSASEAYNLFVPAANFAAMSCTKLDTVETEVGSDIGTRLSRTERRALRSAKHDQEMPAASSISLKADHLNVARNKFLTATDGLRLVLAEQTVAELKEEYEKAKKEKESIKKKIEKAEHYAHLVETAAEIVTGGHGAIEAVKGHELGARLGGGAEATGAGAGILGSAVSFGMEMFYEPKMRQLEALMERISDEVTVWIGIDKAQKVRLAQAAVKNAGDHYKNAWNDYKGAIRDRRTEMAKIGAKASHKAHPHGSAHHDESSNAASDTLWIETVMEAQSALMLGLSAGREAKSRLDEVIPRVAAHRDQTYERYSERMSAITHRERADAPDVKALNRMSTLTDAWMSDAAAEKSEVDEKVGKQPSASGKGSGAAGALAEMGFTDKF
jgi:hypothetical protein